MNLKKGSSGDWDLLAENRGMIVEQNSESGINLTLQKFSPYAVVITPIEEGKAKIEVYYRNVRQSMPFTWTLGAPREMELAVEIALGLLRKQDLKLEIPLARTLEAVCLLLEQPLKINPIKLTIAISETGKKRFGITYKGRFGRTRKETVRTLKALLKLLKGD